MREILFRGKETGGDYWIYGTYLNHLKRTPCPMGDRVKRNDWKSLIVFSGYSDWNMPKPIDYIEVDPETVGQYTGLTDKNGKKIFEGDIIQILCYSYDELESEYFGIVECGELGNGLRDPDGKEGYIWNYLYELQGSYTTTYEVLGNIHDNPELLEQEDEQ